MAQDSQHEHPTASTASGSREAMIDVLLASAPTLPDGRPLDRTVLETLSDEALRRQHDRWLRILEWAGQHRALLDRYRVPDARMTSHRAAVQARMERLRTVVDAGTDGTVTSQPGRAQDDGR